MELKKVNNIVTYGTSIVGFILLGWWFFANPVSGFTESLPGMDSRPAGLTAGADVAIGALYSKFDGKPSNIDGEWSRFRGSNFDNINAEETKLADNWKGGAPPVLWSIDLGEGHAGAIVSDGKVYILDYDETKRADILRCFSFEDGKEIWRRGYDVYLKRNHGISRTVPAIKNNRIVTIGPKCHVMCVEADSGKFLWGVDLEKEFGTEMPLWYTGQCPLIDDSLAIIGVGGKSLIAAFSLKTGKVVWEVPNEKKWKMSHSSIFPFTIFNKKVYVYSAIGGMIGVDEKGTVVFETTLFNPNVVAPSPVYIGDGKIFMTAGYGAGSALLQLKQNGEKFDVVLIQKFKPNQGIASEQQTPIFYKGHLFSILPKDGGTMRNQFVCYNPNNLKKPVWSSGKTTKFGLGPYLVANDKILILSDEGELTLIKASPTEYAQLAQAKILNGHDAWAPLALVKGRLLARDSKKLVCLDLRANRGDN